MRKTGKYIVIEGHDGTGKSTQVALLRDELQKQGIASVEMHEPGGIPIAHRLREVIKDGSLERDPITNLLLFTAARRELWQQLAKPALDQGKWVIAARNWYSTLVYQGYGEGIDRSLIERVTRDFTDERYLTPDFACILILPDKSERNRRINERGNLETPDNFESKDHTFQASVEAGYISLAKDFHLPIINAARSPEIIRDELLLYIT